MPQFNSMVRRCFRAFVFLGCFPLNSKILDDYADEEVLAYVESDDKETPDERELSWNSCDASFNGLAFNGVSYVQDGVSFGSDVLQYDFLSEKFFLNGAKLFKLGKRGSYELACEDIELKANDWVSLNGLSFKYKTLSGTIGMLDYNMHTKETKISNLQIFNTFFIPLTCSGDFKYYGDRGCLKGSRLKVWGIPYPLPLSVLPCYDSSPDEHFLGFKYSGCFLNYFAGMQVCASKDGNVLISPFFSDPDKASCSFKRVQKKWNYDALKTCQDHDEVSLFFDYQYLQCSCFGRYTAANGAFEWLGQNGGQFDLFKLGLNKSPCVKEVNYIKLGRILGYSYSDVVSDYFLDVAEFASLFGWSCPSEFLWYVFSGGVGPCYIQGFIRQEKTKGKYNGLISWKDACGFYNSNTFDVRSISLDLGTAQAKSSDFASQCAELFDLNINTSILECLNFVSVLNYNKKYCLKSLGVNVVPFCGQLSVFCKNVFDEKVFEINYDYSDFVLDCSFKNLSDYQFGVESSFYVWDAPINFVVMGGKNAECPLYFKLKFDFILGFYYVAFALGYYNDHWQWPSFYLLPGYDVKTLDQDIADVCKQAQNLFAEFEKKQHNAALI